MEQREKLIELLDGLSIDTHDDVISVVDWLIANGVVVLPCKVGDTVYEVRNNTDACFYCPCYSDFYGLDVMCSREGEDIVEYPNLSEEQVCEKHYYEVLRCDICKHGIENAQENKCQKTNCNGYTNWEWRGVRSEENVR